MTDVSANFINPEGMHRPTGYTHVVEVTAGRPVCISGQIALDGDGDLVGPGDVGAQARQVFENLQAALRSVGAGFEQVVKVTVYLVERSVGAGFEQVVKVTVYLVDATQMPTVRQVRNQYVDPARPPASTAVEVRRLVRDDLLVEVDAVAILPS